MVDRTQRPSAALAILLLGLGACASQQRMVVPEHPYFEASRPIDRQHLALQLTRFEVSNRGAGDQDSAEAKLASSFRTYLVESARYASVSGLGAFTAAAPNAVPVELQVAILLDQDVNRTILLDILAAYPGLGVLQPLTPEWGEVSVELTLLVRWPEHSTPERIKLQVKAPYSSIFYSWYRSDQSEAAFRRAYDSVFSQVAERLADQLGRWIGKDSALALSRTTSAASPSTELARREPPEVTRAPAPAEPSPAPTSTTGPALAPPPSALAMLPSPTAPPVVELPRQGFRLIDAPIGNARDDWLYRYFGALGGLEAGLFRGGASVESRTRRPSGLEERVGAGDASSEGYRFALFRPPSQTGFFFPPSIGFLSETITISGFREHIPLGSPVSTGARDIPAVASDPSTGLPVDIEAPISYLLRLKSGFLGQGIGANLVLGGDAVQFFGTLAVGLNLVELRHADVTIDVSRVEGLSFAFLRSGQASGQLGVSIPDLHLAVRVSAEYGWYWAFDYPKPIEFLAHVEYDPTVNAFVRQRSFVTGASLSTVNWQLSAVALF